MSSLPTAGTGSPAMTTPANLSGSPLLFTSASGHVPPTSSRGHAAGGASDAVSHFAITTSADGLNFSGVPTTPGSVGEEGGALSGAVVALLIGLITLGLAVLALLLYLKVNGKLHVLVPCGKVRLSKRRSSSTGSRRPLDVDDPEDEGTREDDLPVTREATMFTIDDFEPVHDDEEGSRPGNGEEYFYDEVFGQSMFEDEATNVSMRQLYTAAGGREVSGDDDDEFDLDVIVQNITGARHHHHHHHLSPPPPSGAAATGAGRKT